MSIQLAKQEMRQEVPKIVPRVSHFMLFRTEKDKLTLVIYRRLASLKKSEKRARKKRHTT